MGWFLKHGGLKELIRNHNLSSIYNLGTLYKLLFSFRFIIMNVRFLILLSLTMGTLSACGHYNKSIDLDDAKYWQRKNVTSALYLRGPKAQQTLHMNISECVSKLKELEKLGEIKRAIPKDYSDEGKLATWDTPKRDGYLYAEHADYHDFETCMDSKGWERVEYLPYDEAAKAREDYENRYGKKKTHRGMNGRTVVTSVDQPTSKQGVSSPTFND